MASREALLAQVRQTTERFAAGEVPRPSYWGGYRLWADAVELWVEGDARIHDRARWTRSLQRAADGSMRPGPWSVRPTAALNAAPAALQARELCVSAGGRRLVMGLTIRFAPGEFVAILGRNGCGKSLTLHTLAGLCPPTAGTVELEGQPLTQLSRRRIAQRLGLLNQDLEEGFASTVLESVLISRHPHLSLLEREGAADRRLAQAALTRVGLPGIRAAQYRDPLRR